MDDLIQRLREMSDLAYQSHTVHAPAVMTRAADTIARLTQELSAALQRAEAAERDARRLTGLYEIKYFDGHGHWLPDLCVKEGDDKPTIEEFRAAIDAAIAAGGESNHV